jgi:hypothetical protein
MTAEEAAISIGNKQQQLKGYPTPVARMSCTLVLPCTVSTRSIDFAA